LDGLSKKGPEQNSDNTITESWEFDPTEADEVLVEWSVPKQIREEAIAEVANVLRGVSVQVSDGAEVTDADLP